MSAKAHPVIEGSDLPLCLKEIADPPDRLFFQGRRDLIHKEPKVAVIGTRRPTPYGQSIAKQLGRDLADAGICVVSGLALGIDGLVQEAVVEAGGETIAVLGSAIDDIRPKTNGQLAKAIQDRGLILSEYGPGCPQRNWYFPARNRIISGLVRAVVIIEAGRGSGTLITARYALAQGREVLAFPGQVDSAMSVGTHELIREGARLVRDGRDIREDLGIGADLELPFEKGNLTPYNGGENDGPLLRCLGETPMSLEVLLERSGVELKELHSLLLQEELAGRIRQLPGPRYVRSDRWDRR